MVMRKKPMRAKKLAPRPERGVALVLVMICMLILLTLSTLMILSAGVESYLNANYRSSTKAFYAAKNGLEEGRGRLTPRGTDFAISNAIKIGGTNPIPKGQVVYIVNPVSGQVVDPTDLSTGNLYADNEYQQEFGIPVTVATGLQPVITSTSPVAGLPGPAYQWVRINPVTEKSLNIRVNGDGNPPDPASPLYYDGTSLNLNPPGHPGSNDQVLEVTALSVLPDNTRKMLQYVVEPKNSELFFPSSLTFPGPIGTFTPPNRSTFSVEGRDMLGGISGIGNPCATATPETPARYAVGVSSSADNTTVKNAIPYPNQYTGAGASSPSVSDGTNPPLSLIPAFQTPQSLAGLVTTITQYADHVVTPAVSGSPVTSLPDYGSYSRSLITVVQGDIALPDAGIEGFGLLLVTGNYSAAGSVRWKGIILVMGGTWTITSTGSGEYDGAVLIANISNPGTFGPVTVNWANDNNGIYYNSCWVKKVQLQIPSDVKVLSFREIPLQQP
jgi:hypothetical protein